MAGNLEWRDVLAAERNDGFRRHVGDLTARGMRAIGLLGPLAVALYILLRAVGGREISWVLGRQDAVVVWDKLLIAVLAASLFPLSRAAVARSSGRWLGILAASVAAVLSVVDDLLGSGYSISSAWVALFMVIVAVAMPLNPRQVVALALMMLLALFVPAHIAGMDPAWHLEAQMVFLASMAVSLSAMSMLLYRSRLVQYLATERAVSLSDDLADKAKRIENLERMKSRFFTGIIHDIRTPLSLVLGPITDLLDHHEDDLIEPVAVPLRIARRNAERLRLLVDDLLDLSQLEAGQLHLNRRPRELGRLLDLWILDLQPLAERNGVALALRQPEDPEPVVADVDPDRMEQVVQNLVGNAIGHTPRGGRVEVSLEPVADGRTRIRVSDSGAGISAEHLPHVFDRFYRASRDAARAGHGLGLAIASELTELHDGHLSAASEPGSGSTFTVEIAASADPFEELIEEHARPAAALAAHQPPPDRPEPRETTGHPHVLIVDDNEEMRRYLRRHLELQYRVSEAADGEEALECLRSDPPGLVLSDVVMPGLDGIELCRTVRADPATSTLPVVLLTARGDTPTLVAGTTAGADAFLVKPFDADALVAILENLIELRRMLAPPSTVGPTEVLVESADQAFVERVREVVERHLGDSNFGVDWLADEVGMASRTLQRRLRKATRLSAAGFIRMMRLGRAAQLLEAGATNVSETAYTVGFRDVDHFTRIFRQTFGILPSDYARKGQNDVPEAS